MRFLHRLLDWWRSDHPVSPLWLKQQAQTDSKVGDPPIFINWQAMRALKDRNRP